MFSTDNRFLKLTIEKSLRDLPTLPVVVTRVIEETDRPEATAHSVEEVLSTDQALTTKVLRVVNSAYYGLSGQVTSVSQAIVILGMHQVRNLALSVGALSAIQARTPRQQEMLRRFWLHAFGSASASHYIASKRSLPSRDLEIAFVGGLLHDIGRLFLFCNFTEIYDDLMAYAAEQKCSIESAELTFLGMTHAAIGEAMATAWKLPSVLAEVIGRHEGPFGEGEPPSHFCAHLGDHVTKYLYDASHMEGPLTADPIALAWFGGKDNEWDEIREMVDDRVEQATAMFGLMAA